MTKVYVGNIPEDTREREVEDAFTKFGRLESVWIAKKPPGFAFVTFEDARDADDAVKEMDGRDFLGRKLKVEISRRDDPPKRARDHGDDYRDRGRERDRDSKRPARGGRDGYVPGKYRVRIKGINPRMSWQDLKDFMRDAGEVCYTEVNGGGEGLADFLSADDMDRAIRKLDGVKEDGEILSVKEFHDDSDYVRQVEKEKGRDKGRYDERERGRYDDRDRGRHDDRDRGRERRHSRSRSGDRDRR